MVGIANNKDERAASTEQSLGEWNLSLYQKPVQQKRPTLGTLCGNVRHETQKKLNRSCFDRIICDRIMKSFFLCSAVGNDCRFASF